MRKIELIGLTLTESSARLALSLVMRLDRLGVLSCDLSSTICDGGAGCVLSPDGSVSGMLVVGGASCIFFRCPLSPLYTVPSVPFTWYDLSYTLSTTITILS